MATALRVALVTFRADLFQALHAGCVRRGHVPALCVSGRSGRPGGPSYPNVGERVAGVLGGIASDLDLLLPGDVQGLATALRGYRTDVAVVCGLSWWLPRSVRRAPRLGIINVHASLLPRYRGPAPVQWAIRNGDSDIGLTAHWMDRHIDTGNIIVQRGGIPLPEYVSFEELWDLLTPAIPELVGDALDRAAAGYAGEPQHDEHASYAGAMEREFDLIDWSQPARTIHNQVRTFYLGTGTPGPIGEIDNVWVRVRRTRLAPGEGIRLECGDGPIWVVDTEPVDDATVAELTAPNPRISR